MEGNRRFPLQVAVLLLAIGLLAPSALAQSVCPREVPTIKPRWAVTGEWSTGEDPHLLLTDSKERVIIRFSRKRGAERGLSGEVDEALRLLRPTGIQRTDSGYSLFLRQGGLVLMNEDFRPISVRNLEQELAVHEAGIFKRAMVGDDLVACMDVKMGATSEWESGFARISLAEESPTPEFVYRFQSTTSVARLFCRILGPYITSLVTAEGERQGYILVMEERPRILRLGDADSGVVPLEAFPQELEKRPDILPLPLGAEFETIMGEIEFSRLAVGLYGWEGHLYVFSREPAGSGETIWSLTKIDPVADKVIGSAVVPAEGNHVFAVPGPKEWAFVEKGPAKAWNSRHTAESVLFVPAEAIRSIEEDGQEICRR